MMPLFQAISGEINNHAAQDDLGPSFTLDGTLLLHLQELQRLFPGGHLRGVCKLAGLRVR
jgi:hypothetical protein